jgi:DNA-directed RNA polymerase specialized sigma24 family protein
LAFKEIAELLGRTVAATRQMLSRIRLTLQSCIEERTAQS